LRYTIFNRIDITMNKLTKVEEQVMQIIWEMESCMVTEVLERIGEPKPPHSTISSVVRILEKKGFVQHKSYGRTHVYAPIISKSDYTKFTLDKVADGYFDGSFKRLVSFLVKENDLDLKDLAEMMKDLEEDK
jgi:BlaI family transcriptional regulator, penicillinase repressor